MINSFRILGKSVLEKEGYYQTDDDIEKKMIFLLQQTIVPHSNEKQFDRAVAIDFDVENNSFSFKLDKELTPEHRKYFFALKITGNNPKKFWATNNINYLFGETFEDSFAYLEERRKSGKQSKTNQRGNIAKYFEENVSKDYDTFIQYLKETFCKELKKEKKIEYVLDENLLAEDQKQIFFRLQAESEKKKKDKTKSVPTGDIYKKLILELYKQGDKKDLPQIFLIKINGSHIFEYDNSKFKSSYINLAYYDLFERFFAENEQKDAVCHICNGNKKIIGDVPLLMKFYGTTTNLYFENLKNKNAYKSFAICKECLRESLTGMAYISNNLRDNLFNISCCLIPLFEQKEQDFEKKYRRIFNLLKTNDSYAKNIEEIENIVKKSEKKDFIFTLLFFEENKQDFDIIKLIPNIEYKRLIEKLKYFDEYAQEYKLSFISQRFNLNDIRYNLFPSKSSHAQYDPKIYRKDILDLLEAFLHEHQINYADMIKRFMDIYKHRFHKDKDKIDRLIPFKMVLILTIFSKLKILKGVNSMQGNAITEIQDAEYKKFLETHKEIYENNTYRQGLFLLGTVINEILKAQREKSSTFLKKIDFNGIPARRVSRLVNEVKEYTQIYKNDVFEVTGIWGNIMDRLQGIETSGMKGEEIVFYILTGISYASYLGWIKSIEKKGGTNGSH